MAADAVAVAARALATYKARLAPAKAVFVSKTHFKYRCQAHSDLSSAKPSHGAALLMRLLDLVAQGRTELVRVDDGRTLPGAECFKDAVRSCPVRYVLDDELARCATQMAFSDGDRLTSCLDLIRVPAQSLWIEWMDASRRAELPAADARSVPTANTAVRAGALLKASANGRAGEIRTFWSTRAELAYVSPIIIRFDLDGTRLHDVFLDPIMSGGCAVLSAPAESGLDGLLEHLGFYFDEEWAAYYRDRCQSREMRDSLVQSNLGGCAFDPPMLFAFLLMLSARSA